MLVTYTMLVLRIANRIWKETKEEPGTDGPGNMLGCCIVSLHFLWAILCLQTVGMIFYLQIISPEHPIIIFGLNLELINWVSKLAGPLVNVISCVVKTCVVTKVSVLPSNEEEILVFLAEFMNLSDV